VEDPQVWLLLGTRRGDMNQLHALASALGLPFEAKALTYNRLRHLPFLRGAGLVMVSRETRMLIRPPWPRLIIGVGYASVHVAREIRRRSGGRTRIVQIGNPRTRVDDLDLVVTTPQYWRAPAANVLALPYPMGNPAKRAAPTPQEQAWLRAYPRPRRVLAVGGPARYWKIDHDALAGAVGKLAARSAEDEGSLVAAVSPRTTPDTRRLLSDLLTGECETLVEDFPRFAVLLAAADEIHVTADSVSMLTEAILTGKPVGMIPIARSLRGRVARALHRVGIGGRPVPDFPYFWRQLAQEARVGPVEEPVESESKDSVTIAARAVRRLLRE
jgi:mitochondrial fission protein ELM1